MSNSKPDVQLSAGLDATDVNDKLAGIEKQAQKMGDRVKKEFEKPSQGLKGMGEEAAKATRDLERTEKGFIASIQRRTAALEASGKGERAYQEALLTNRGLDTAKFKPYLDQLEAADRAQKAASGSLNGIGMSAKATTAALRQVPAQFTDIVTSLQSGQAPLTVLLQQGGQLKDVFGGIGPAARALGGYVLGLVNPFTLGAAALGVLTYGFIKGAQEQTEFARALILTGGAAGVTAGQLGNIAQAVSALSGGTVGRAAELLNSMAAAGLSGANNLQRFAAAAIQLERAGGPAAEETAKAFAELGKAPLAGALKLNEATNFLTRSLVEQIKALEDQGLKTDAARVAQKAYADAVEQRAPAILSQLGVIEQAWLKIKGATKGAGDALFGIGRSSGDVSDLIKAQIRLNELEAKQRDAGPEAASRQTAFNTSVQAQRELVDGLRQRVVGETAVATAQSDQAKQVKLLAEFNKDSSKYLTTSAKLNEDITRTVVEGVAAGAKMEDIQRRVLALRTAADTGAGVEGIKRAENERLEVIKRVQDQINTLRATGYINERGQIEQTTDLDLKALGVRRAALVAEIGLARGRFNSEKEVMGLQTQLAALDGQIITRGVEGRNALTAATYKQAQAIYAVIDAQREEEQAETRKGLLDQIAARNKVAEAVFGTKNALQEQVQLLELEASLVGRSAESRATALEYYRIELDLKRQIAEIDATVSNEDVREEYRAQARANAAQARLNASRRVQLDQNQKFADEIEGQISDALMRGFENGKGFAENLRDTVVNLFKTMVLRPTVQAIVQQGAGAVLGFIGGGQQGGSTGSGLLGAASTANSLYGLGGGTGVGSTLSAYASNAAVYSGSAYGTAFGSQQSAALAAQEAGLTSSAGASSVGAYAGYAALIYAASTAAASDFRKGFDSQSAKNTVAGQPLGQLSDALRKLGISAEAASILSGSTPFAKLFGFSRPTVESQGVQGRIGGGDFTGTAFADIKQRGGLFRKGRNYTETSAVPDVIGRFLDDASAAVLKSAKGYAEALGLPVGALDGISTDIRVALGADKEANAKAITEALGGYGDALVAGFAAAIEPLVNYGEATAQTLERVSIALTGTNEVLKALGQSALAASVAGAKAALDLQALFGGADVFAQAARGYLQAFFTDAERATRARKTLGDQLAQFGVTTLPNTRDAYRALAEAQDLTTESGRKTYAALLSLAGVFAEITPAADAFATSIADAGRSLRAEIDRLRGGSSGKSQAQLLASFATTTAQARAGDAEAIKALPDISKALEEAAKATAGSALDIARIRAFLAASLGDTLKTIPGFASGGTFAGGLRIVGESGAELEATGPSRLYSASDTAKMLTGGNNARLESLVESLTEEVQSLNEAARATAKHTSKTARLIERVMPDGDALATRTAPAV